MSRAVGIDLGSTSVRVAAVDEGIPEAIPNCEGSRGTVAVLAFRPEAGGWLLGSPARRQLWSSPDTTIPAASRWWSSTSGDGRWTSPSSRCWGSPGRSSPPPPIRARLEPLLARLQEVVEEVLAEAGTPAAEIGEVLLAGGSTRIPAVAARVAELFDPERVRRRKHPERTVAIGAAVHAARLDVATGRGRITFPKLGPVRPEALRKDIMGLLGL